MKKMTTLFVIDRDIGLAINEVRPENIWVMNGQGTATVKFDGSACLVKDGVLYKRQNRKLQKKFQKRFNQAKRNNQEFSVDESLFKPVPKGAIACNESFDPVTLHWPYWVPVNVEAPEDLFHLEAWSNLSDKQDGSYEIIGPKFQDNLHDIETHQLVPHGSVEVSLDDFSFEGIRNTLKKLNYEGIVFHHPDGRMCKIRRKDMFEFKHLTSGRKIDWRDSNVIF